MKYFMSYIDDAFLDDFFKQKPTDIDSDSDELDIWRDWLSFVRNKTDIDLAITLSSEDLKKSLENNSLLFSLLNENQQGGSKTHIAVKTNKLEKSTAKDLVLNSEKPTFIFRNNLPNTEITEEKTGFCCINGACFFDKWRFLTKIETKLITKHLTPIRMRSWSELSIWRHPINAIVICDNYILSDQRNINYNLLPLLKELLPTHSLSIQTEIDIDITIISSVFYKDFSTGIQLTATEISRKITQDLNRANISNFNLTIAKVNEQRLIHARDVFTNYFELSSDHSFSYFDRNGNVILPADAILTKKPSINADNIEKRKIRLATIKQLIDNSIEYSGSKNNRLFK